MYVEGDKQWSYMRGTTVLYKFTWTQVQTFLGYVVSVETRESLSQVLPPVWQAALCGLASQQRGIHQTHHLVCDITRRNYSDIDCLLTNSTCDGQSAFVLKKLITALHEHCVLGLFHKFLGLWRVKHNFIY